MRLHILTHNHRHGTSLFQFQCKQEITNYCNVENDPDDLMLSLMKELGVDYEHERGDESVEVECLGNVRDIPTFKL
jgi:hypothetical protein